MPSNDARWITGTVTGIVIVGGGLLAAQIAGVNARLDRIETDIRGLDARLRVVEITLAEVVQRLDTLEQRLETLERFHLPASPPGD